MRAEGEAKGGHCSHHHSTSHVLVNMLLALAHGHCEVIYSEGLCSTQTSSRLLQVVSNKVKQWEYRLEELGTTQHSFEASS